ncbi:hypothetical protein Halha_0482 [Halobacteroides halobius DSM 5150]|uniref:Uncharacterized protein n=1 Tax=Halobacteroides halobius (strain ATCC 35273 / DSM 5150 / MD-1) TaxID=748449 RepID=L0K7Y0_HALHC|nr:hypothetical protein [Halobacteroides halobius]AGB40459.1 hypothetical protein Halha_0482 [Halobacteroides halobius DSM 5150]
MGQLVAGIILIGVIAGAFYLIGSKLGIMDNDNSDDDYSCH